MSFEDYPKIPVGNGYIQVGGCSAIDIASTIDDDEKYFAECHEYLGGSFIVRPNFYEPGSSLRKSVPQGMIRRWFVKHEWVPSVWSYQVNARTGSCCASSESTKSAAIAACRKYLEVSTGPG